MRDPSADKEITMDFVSIRIITDDVARLAGFYERATGVQAAWPSENFAELTTSSATLAIASTRTVPLFAPGAARPADNNTNRKSTRLNSSHPSISYAVFCLKKK